MPRGNRNPKTNEAFVARHQPQFDEVPLGRPRSTRFPVHVDKQLEEMGADRQIFVREAVEKALAGDTPTAAEISLEELQRRVDAVLATVPIAQRRQVAKWFKKLLDRPQ